MGPRFILLGSIKDKLGDTERLASRVFIKCPLMPNNATTMNNCKPGFWHCDIGLLAKVKPGKKASHDKILNTLRPSVGVGALLVC